MDKAPNIYKECVKVIEEQKRALQEGDLPYGEGDKEKGFKVTLDRIFKILPSTGDQTLGFVDGGSGVILKGADFSISLNRVAGAMYRKNEFLPLKTMPTVVEFYTTTILKPLEDEQMAYHIQMFPREEKFDDFLPEDNEIILPIQEVRRVMGFRNLPEIERFGAVAMRFAEWKYATELIKQELQEGDILVRDGSLQTGFTGEILLVRKLNTAAMHKNVYLTGLSKSCRLLTTKGESLISLIDIFGDAKFPEKPWYYHPIFQITRADNLADVYFVKLHAHSRSPFRFDIFIEQSQKLSQQEKGAIISAIASNSTDLSFPGYPYGLIKVDQLSRVSNRELEPQKIQLLSEFDPEIFNTYIKPRIRAVDAHDLLNKLRKN